MSLLDYDAGLARCILMRRRLERLRRRSLSAASWRPRDAIWPTIDAGLNESGDSLSATG